MKNTIKNVGIIAIVAVIGFSFASCLSLGGGAAHGGPEAYDSWPADSFWANFGLSGLRQPAAAADIMAAPMSGGSYIVSFDGGRAAYDDITMQLGRMGWASYTMMAGSSTFSHDDKSATVILSLNEGGAVGMQLMK